MLCEKPAEGRLDGAADSHINQIDGGNSGRCNTIFLAIILLAVLGKTTGLLLGLAERRLLRWSDAHR